MLRIARLIFLLFFVLLIAEVALALLGFKPYSQRRAEIGLAKEKTAGSLGEMIDKGLMRGIYGELKPDSELGYTYYKKPLGFNDEKNFYDDWSKYKRVLILGDSFAAGHAAQAKKSFVELLNHYYEKKGIIFFNTGVGGYGQNNQLAVLKKYHHIIKPHLVLLCFYPGNDFLDNLTPKDRFTAFPEHWIMNYQVLLTKDHAEIRRREPEEIFRLYQEALYKESVPRFIDRFRISTLAWLAQGKFKNKLIHIKKKIQNWYRPKRDYAYLATRDYILEIKEYLAARKAPLEILIIPDISASKNKLKKSYNYNRAVALFEELQLPYLDMFDSLTLADYRAKESEHWNDHGHFKAYVRLKKHINQILEVDVE